MATELELAFIAMGQSKSAAKIAKVRAETPIDQCMVSGCTRRVHAPDSWWCSEHHALRNELLKEGRS